MSAPLSLDQQITGLVAEVDESIRTALQAALKTLRDAHNIPGAILTVSRLMEGSQGFLTLIAKSAGSVLTGDNLKSHIEQLFNKKIIPQEIGSDLDAIRIRANKARHQAEEARLTMSDAEMVLGRGLRVVEWYYCESEHGPKLAATAKAPPLMLTPAGPDARQLVGNWRCEVQGNTLVMTLSADRSLTGRVEGGFMGMLLPAALMGEPIRGKWDLAGDRLCLQLQEANQGLYSGVVGQLFGNAMSGMLSDLRIVDVSDTTLTLEFKGGRWGWTRC